jgi:tetratricopeptide (TPR) repeat protein
VHESIVGECRRASKLLTSGSYREAALAFEGAARRAPSNPIPALGLAEALARSGNRERAVAELDRALELDPELIRAHVMYAEILLAAGDMRGALDHVKAAYKPVQGSTITYTGAAQPVRTLAINAAGLGGLTNVEPVFNPETFEVQSIIAEYWPLESGLPDHDVAINCIADPDACGAALDIAEHLLADYPEVINPPHLVRATGRVRNAQRFADLEGVRAARVAEFPRAELAAPSAARRLEEAGFSFPLLLRAPGFHNGANFHFVEDAGGMLAAIAALPGETMLAIEYLDYRSPDGKFRKYRAMYVDGAVYPAHLAVSRDWNVHYFSAQMGPAERAEERAYLEDLPAALGERAASALARVFASLGLHYAGADFSIDANGDAIVFEANAAMTVFMPEETPANAYRRAAVEKIYGATQAMLVRHARPRHL